MVFVMEEQLTGFVDQGTPIDLGRVLIGLRRLRWIILSASIAGSVLGAVIAKSLMEPIFEARVVLECDRCSRPDYGDRELATLQETIKLPQHLEHVRQKMQLNATIENLDFNIDVDASMESRLIRVSARQKKSELAAGVANGIVEAFLETRLQIERDIANQRVQSLLADAQNARTSVNDARSRYDSFRRENNIADLPAERQAAIQEAARLRSELALARGEEEAERARAIALRRASSQEPSTTILEESEELPNAKRLAEARAQLTAAQARLSADHPRVQVLTTEIEMLEQKLALANESVTTGRTVGINPQWESAQRGIIVASANREAANTRHTTYEKLAEQSARAAARLSNIEGQASELLSSLENAERHAATIALDLKVAEDAARKPSTGLRILAPARAPTNAIESPRKVVALLGPLAGVIVAAILSLLYELRGLRIHSASELTYWGKGPTIASSFAPQSATSLQELAEDLTDWSTISGAKIAMVGVTNHEHSLVETLVQNMRESGLGQARSIDAFSPNVSAPSLRRGLRAATHVLVVVSAGKHSAFKLQNFAQKLVFLDVSVMFSSISTQRTQHWQTSRVMLLGSGKNHNRATSELLAESRPKDSAIFAKNQRTLVRLWARIISR
jgi:uncharacterized protein involved in exopolysaccharide biosynthesis